MSDPDLPSIESAALPGESSSRRTGITRMLVAIAFAVLLTAAAVVFFSLQPRTFPGYTYAGDSAQHDQIFINSGSMVYMGGAVRAKVLYRPGSSRTYDYLIADLVTNCSGKFALLSATPFRTNGAPMQELDESALEGFHGTTEAAAKFVCANSEDLKTIPQAFDSLRAIEMLYGPADRVAKTAIWLHPPKPPVEFDSFDSTKEYTVHLVSTLETTEGGVRKKYLIASAYPTGEEPCHACSTIIGAAEFKLVNSGWLLEAFGPFAARGLGLGTDPSAKLIQIGPDRSAVWLTMNGYLNGGFEEEDIQILATVGNWIGQVFAHDTSASDSMCDTFPNVSCYSNKTIIQFVPGHNPDYYDIQAATTGTKGIEQGWKVVSADHSQTFTLVGHSYR
jgi:hypothetical protein